MRQRTTDPRAFGRVGVLMGGWSAERQVSLWSGEGVLAALISKGVDVVGIDADRATVLSLGARGIDRVFNVMHGTGGEDGSLQACLELQNIPYTGSGVLASALAMDKLLTKRIWKAEGLPTPEWLVLHDAQEALRAGEKLGYPYFVKPAAEGSSVGIGKVKFATSAVSAFRRAQGDYDGIDRTVVAEKFVDGPEYTCAILDGEALPIIRIEPDGEFYDYNAKYISDNTRYHCPAGLDAPQEAQIAALCLRAFQLIGAHGWGRVDFMLDPQQQPWLLEVNLVPGMTSHSLVPMAAKARGLGYADLCWALLETTLEGGR
ncbi:MAG TPA: D-alanine--D-alanine ligase [Nevskiaceae bacterium]|nr:D-alanine--D-alanine ligase [Nevskiaceae bacterium]